MRFYECIFVVHPSVPEEEIDQITQLILDLIKSHDGEVLKTEKWGKRKLAYAVKKERYGYYVFIYFKCLGPVLKQIDRRLNLHEKVIKHMTVNVDEKSPDELKPVPANVNVPITEVT
ncbi:MAG: 30S ribosomal protein S6, partial [Candidatus Schekmanbacteria bacterium RBG_13_48_7]